MTRERHDNNLEQFSKVIAERKRLSETPLITLDEFRTVYELAKHSLGKDIGITIVRTTGTSVTAQFSELTPQRFLIVSNTPLLREAFDFANQVTWYGGNAPRQSFTNFIFSEIKLNWRKLFPILAGSFLLLQYTNDNSIYDLISGYIIQSATVFLSIYLIFTMSQSQRIMEDVKLYKAGIVHRYVSDDRNVTIFGILVIALTFFNSIYLSILDTHPVIIDLGLEVLNAKFWKSATTSIVITLLFNSFISVSEYYLERTADVIERDVIDEILHKDYIDLKENLPNSDIQSSKENNN